MSFRTGNPVYIVYFFSQWCKSVHVLPICSNRSELEDMELKHNSTVKQLMREFNSQMALKEQELETAVKESIGMITLP